MSDDIREKIAGNIQRKPVMALGTTRHRVNMSAFKLMATRTGIIKVQEIKQFNRFFQRYSHTQIL